MNKKAYPLALLSLLTALPSEAQSVADTLSYTATNTYRPDTLSNAQKTNQLLLQGALSAAPLVGIGVMQNIHNEQIRTIRYGHYPHFHHHYDDYLQFAQLAAQLGLRFAGVEGTSKSPWQMLTADAAATATMLAVTSAIKYTACVRRPDGSSRNSFPSGHTAMAFTSATLLSLEYGERYPWLPPVSYGLASITGLGRILNNRHWIGDVVTGAGLGILSGHIGYWISDRLFGSTGRQLKYYNEEPTPHLRLYAPIR